MAKNTGNPKENSEDVQGLIPLRSRSDSVAGFLSESYAIALPARGRGEEMKQLN
jgi:hypothetical protein